MKHLILVGVGLVLAGCDAVPSSRGSASEAVLQLGRLDPGRAEGDARQALLAGDTRLVAVAGYSLEIAGTDLSAEQAGRAYGVKEVSGTTDVLSGNEAKSIEDAKSYAARYNRIVLDAKPGRRSH